MSTDLKKIPFYFLSSFLLIRISKNGSSLSFVFIVNLMEGFLELKISNNLFGSISTGTRFPRKIGLVFHQIYECIFYKTFVQNNPYSTLRMQGQAGVSPNMQRKKEKQ